MPADNGTDITLTDLFDEAGNGNHVGIASKTERLLKREAG